MRRMCVYRMTNEQTGEVIEGCIRELEQYGFVDSMIRNASSYGYMYGQWSVIKTNMKVIPPEKKEKHVVKTSKKLTEINAIAREHGMSYGQWVAFCEKGQKTSWERQNITGMAT